MLFNSLAYLVFLPIVTALYWLSPKVLRTALLLIASYVFYMSWKPIYGLLIFGLTAINYFFGLAIDRSLTRKKIWLAAAVVCNLLALAYFKYTYYGLELTNQALAAFGTKVGPLPFEIILPLGISFFVFEFIHYVVDVYKGGKPIKGFLDFSLFASFFPTQLAGPIKRYQDFIPQLSAEKKLSLKDFDEGLWLIIFGLSKKVIFADNLAAVVESGFSHPQLLSVVDTWLVVYAFAFQLYFDFSGYTDIARGSARLLGFKVPVNFNLPYLAGSIADFWRRWHISLSSWLRDYLFIPLGGSKCSRWFNYRNLFLTMLLGGLWHGAATHFVVWGAYQGAGLLLHKMFKESTEKIAWFEKLRQTPVYHWLAVLLTFNVTCIGWVLFRAPNMDAAGQMTSKMLLLDGIADWRMTIVNVQEPAIFLILPAVIALLIAAQLVCGWWSSSRRSLTIPMPVRAVGIAFMIIALLIFSPDTSPKFVYFQF